MVFSSLTFLFVFLPLVVVCYYVLPEQFWNLTLLIFSLIFYAWGEPVYILLMLFSITVNYLMGRAIEEQPEKAKGYFIYTVILNLFVLGFFKYAGFLVDTFNAIFHTSFEMKKLSLPIGISFYTFQALSYIIDLYRGKIKCQKSYIRFALYITMFPQLIAGPIVRYSDVEKQLESRKVNFAQLGQGSQRFLVGLTKKVLLANTIGSLYETIHAMGADVSMATAWIGAIAYMLQIYFDFSGYSDMAIGLGRIFGFTFPANFDHPYLSKSVTEFWRRWHISLGTWFREYVYIPLGGNRVRLPRHICNILIVWLLTGLWHGASWNFILWGLYYGLLLLWEKFAWKKIKELLHIKTLPAVFEHLFTLLAVIIGWVIFSSDSVGAIMTTLKAMVGLSAGGLWDLTALYFLKTNGIWLLVGCIASTALVHNLLQLSITNKRKIVVACDIFVFLACVACLVTQNYNPFLYFRF